MSAPAIKAAPKGSPVEKRWKAAELRTKLAELRALLQTGKSDIQCAEDMGLDVQSYNALKRELYAQDKADIASKSVEEVFIDYSLKQQGCIADLEEMVTHFKASKQYNAMIGAIKAKSDIIDKIISRGQEFGLVEKVPEKKQLVAGVMVAGLNTDELRGFIVKQLSGLNDLMSRYGSVDILGAPVAAPALPAHIPGPAPAAAAVVPAVATSVVKPVAKPPPPTFGAKGKPFRSAGGLSKVAGGKAKAAASRAEVSDGVA